MIRKQEINYDNYEIYKTLNKDELKEALNEAKIRLEKEKKLVAFLKNLKLEANKNKEQNFLKENLKEQKNKFVNKKNQTSEKIQKFLTLTEFKDSIAYKNTEKWAKENPKEAKKVDEELLRELKVK